MTDCRSSVLLSDRLILDKPVAFVKPNIESNSRTEKASTERYFFAVKISSRTDSLMTDARDQRRDDGTSREKTRPTHRHARTWLKEIHQEND